MSDFDKVKYNNDYNKNNYDRCIFNLPKGQKPLLQIYFKNQGYKSLNEYINALIKADLEKNNATISEA